MSFFLGFNWKMNPAQFETASNLLQAYCQLPVSNSLNTVIFPPSIYFYPSLKKLKSSTTSISIGLQDISANLEGAFTGEISAKMLSNLQTKSYVLIGHSETRENFKLNNQTISKKASISLQNNLIPVLCIGYGLSSEVNYELLKKQVSTVLNNVKFTTDNEIIIAYEPVWAIGSGKAASKEHIAEVLDMLRSFLKQDFPEIESKIQLIYGGSVKPDNALDLASIKNLKGFLIGGVSLKPDQFSSLFKILNK